MKVNKKLLALLTISLGMGIARCFKSEQKIENKTTSENVYTNNKNQTEKVDTNDNENLGTYTIESISDESIANAKRETLHIVVKDNQSLNQLYTIAQKETLNYTKDHPGNALIIGFYTDKEHIGEGYDMGSVLYCMPQMEN
ncbi:hypothetical protein [Paraclostridium bifermentans]|uniref:hypothetical protein n=1 Tax=Paraclostridium bifermentans TaxID=1490 RepID=UPI00374F6736